MRDNEKRLTVALDGATYKALRQLGLDTDSSNQSMIERAIKQFIAGQAADARKL